MLIDSYKEKNMSEAIDHILLKRLTLETQAIRKVLQVKGTTTFVASAETSALRQSIISLIADLQFYGVLPKNFHIADGTVIRHLPEE